MTATNSGAPVGRLVPSPTGSLHVGHARSFLLAWWSIRSRNGRILLRMEDLDHNRVRPGMADAVLRDLEWLGLDWDGEVVFQSQRLDLYREAIVTLQSRDLLYPCVCSRREIRLAQSAPHADEETSSYPGTCRGRFRDRDEAHRLSGMLPALRFLVPPGEVVIEDRLAGRLAFDVGSETGDFPLWNRADIPAYQLAVVVDDADQGVTEVLRGDDLLSSTARQSLLQDALSLPHPEWVHVPLVTDAAGRRLASRSGDLPLADLRAAGVDPGSIVAWAAATCGMPAEGRGLPGEMLREFDLSRLPSAPVRVDPSRFPPHPEHGEDAAAPRSRSEPKE